MQPDIEWLGDQVIDGVVERSFRLTRAGRRVPGVLWLPPSGCITAPLLLHVQRDDEIFPRDGQLELFDLIGSPAKRLVIEAGPTRTPRPRRSPVGEPSSPSA
jgi:hypothetical protein